MTGKYEISLQSKKLNYVFEIKRKYTIIRGCSAKGKSELCRLVSEKGCIIKCSVRVAVLRSDIDYETLLACTKNTIYLVDESFDAIGTTEFTNIMKNSDNYFVLISRRKLSNIPYSINEIYTLESKRLEKKLNNVTNITTKKYKSLSKEDFEPDMLITEDSGSGYDFFKAFLGENKCISARGKDKVEVELRKKLKDIDKLRPLVSFLSGNSVKAIVLFSILSKRLLAASGANNSK